MVEIPDSLHSLFSARVEERDGAYVIEVPRDELASGSITAEEAYRIGVFGRVDGSPAEEATSDTSDRGSPDRTGRSSGRGTDGGPPVEEGEVRDVTIESLGDKGDGIAKVERGYVVIVPDTRPGEEVTVEIEEARENVSFAAVVEPDRGAP